MCLSTPKSEASSFLVAVGLTSQVLHRSIASCIFSVGSVSVSVSVHKVYPNQVSFLIGGTHLCSDSWRPKCDVRAINFLYE